MITVKDTHYSADSIKLTQILYSTSKVNMLKICKKLDLYVSPNIKKADTAVRLAKEIIDNPISVLSVLNKYEMQLASELVHAEVNEYVVRKMRKTPYMLQKLDLVISYEDSKNNQWHIIMPTDVRNSLANSLPLYLKMIEDGIKPPTQKDLRHMNMMSRLFGDVEYEL